MWMMGYNDAGEFNTIEDPFTGRKLRPLMPRPVTAAATASTNHPCLTRIHGADHFLCLNHHLAMLEQNKRDLTTQQVVVSSRWNPTSEQLQTLEELYRRGTRTPTAEQIQLITAQLRRYGKIEGKNVFYWFQNHKARDRQKRRRPLDPLSHDHHSQQQPNKEEKREPPGSNRTAIEVEETKNWASSTNSSTIAEKTAQGATKGAEILLQQRRNATWQMMHLSCSPSSSSSPLSSSYNDDHSINIFNLEPNHRDDEGEAQTLQLFPLQGGLNDDDEGCGPQADHVMTSTPYQFFEFLPIKN